ncbi:hypothetical protein PCASD_15500 [Puccinia coronata f. sp. avenae]|uniref:Uncharacterized protein n=1 Tax=Puccinia coronata f. sp. avenae TaxID=200324 RepID=A0A2N5UCD3_9BASI|nr:hypothetical protein PCASD_15500 [Puccinia coronata f. sp. avenae]
MLGDRLTRAAQILTPTSLCQSTSVLIYILESWMAQVGWIGQYLIYFSVCGVVWLASGHLLSDSAQQAGRHRLLRASASRFVPASEEIAVGRFVPACRELMRAGNRLRAETSRPGRVDLLAETSRQACVNLLAENSWRAG